MTLVVGLGSPDRGDDAVGLLVCAAMEAEGVADVRVRPLADASLLPALWAGEHDVVVVDAVRSPEHDDGTLLLIDLADGVGVPEEGSTHGFDLAAAVSLAAAVGTMPSRLHLVGVVGSCFDLGRPASASVLEAVPTAVGAVRDLAASGSAAGAVPRARAGQGAVP